MKYLRALWYWLTTSTQFALVEAENQRLKETNAALEEENVLLRKESRALTNTILGQAGVAPLPPAEEVKPVPRMRRMTTQQQRRVELTKAERTAITEAIELRKRFEQSTHGVQRSN